MAGMAIRLGLLQVSNLPKADIMVLDEPATALDEEHIQSFTNMLDMIKSQFKTTLLISHLDSLKDIADKIIEITKKDNFACVRE
jgi:ABC-2 type transport system ATP-binding protein